MNTRKLNNALRHWNYRYVLDNLATQKNGHGMLWQVMPIQSAIIRSSL